MYEIRPESIKTFIEDSNIKLPRFQRKQTWDEKKNFKLCISLFKEYPLGVSILSVEKMDNKTTRWLLDGRQRRNALLKMAEDPENIYLWGKKFIGYKESMQQHEVEDKFWQKINEYLELDEIESEKSSQDTELALDTVSEPEDAVEEEQPEEENSQVTETGLDLLLKIILLVHNKTKKFSGFSKPFDFTSFIDSLPYVEIVAGKTILSSKKIRSFIKEYKSFCADNEVEFEKEVSFKQFMLSRFRLSTDGEKKLSVELSRAWKKIIDRINLIDKLDNILLNAKIGIIEVKNIGTADGQKIFNIINSEGTLLTVVEILSAKPSWTKELKNPSSELVAETRKLYNLIGIKAENVVRWDLPATLLSRLNEINLIFKKFDDNKTVDFEKKLTLGFKILSGYLLNGVKKDDVNALSTRTSINWETDIEKLITDIQLYLRLLNESEYFKYLQSWKASIMTMMSDTIALNFFLLTFKDWERKGKPIGANSNVRNFQKNAFILMDRLVYEYVTRQWRGSGDTRIAQNLKEFPNTSELFIPVEKLKWLELLKEIFDKNSIDGLLVNQNSMEPILYHFYCLSKIAGPDSSIYTIETDHIIPQSLFKESVAFKDRDEIMNNLFNLGLLPKKENISKSNKKLNEITDSWLKDQISKYEFIKEQDYEMYSKSDSIEKLKESRRKIFENAFSLLRTEKIG